MSCLISSFSASFRSGNPSKSAGVSIFFVVALARCKLSEGDENRRGDGKRGGGKVGEVGGARNRK